MGISNHRLEFRSKNSWSTDMLDGDLTINFRFHGDTPFAPEKSSNYEGFSSHVITAGYSMGYSMGYDIWFSCDFPLTWEIFRKFKPPSKHRGLMTFDGMICMEMRINIFMATLIC